MNCPRCGEPDAPRPDNTCRGCGYQFTEQELHAGRARRLPPSEPFHNSSRPPRKSRAGKHLDQFADFMAFRSLITPDGIRIFHGLYVLALVFGLMAAISELFDNEITGRQFLIGVAVGIASYISWRIFCEFLIVVFSIHECLWSASRRNRR